jgi:hypothetical protein
VSAALADHIVRPARGDDHGQAHCGAFEPPVAPSVQRGDRGDGRGRLVGGGGRWASSSSSPTPACFAARIDFLKDEVFDICGALALAESLLKRLGMDCEAAHLAAVFDVVEARLVVPLPP